MLKKPDFPYPQNEGKGYVCLEDGQYVAYLDRDATRSLLRDLYWFYDAPLGEEISIRSAPWKGLPQRGQRIRYCEFNRAPDHFHKKQGKNILKEAQPIVRHKPHGVYTPGHVKASQGRLDYFVSPVEIKIAYEALTLALENSNRKRTPQEVTLFDTLVVRLVLP